MSRDAPRDPEQLRGLPRSALRSLWRTYHEPPPRHAIQFLTTTFWPWFKHYLAVVFHERHAFPVVDQSSHGIIRLPDSCVIGLAADWGTGTPSAYKVANRIKARERPHDVPDVTIHLGDVYYSGTDREYEDWFLGEDDWPRGTLVTLALNGNHEMYSGGGGYFDKALRALNQSTSYACLENSHWRILALDSGYYSGIFPLIEPLLRSRIRLHDDILEWLGTIYPDPRPTIVLTHHPLFSAFDSEYPTLGKNLAPYLPSTLLWIWGHEHRFAAYAPLSYKGLPPVRARCIGHGGMPIEVTERPKRTDRHLVCYDKRPDGEKSSDKTIGYCGYARLRMSGVQLSIEYRDEDDQLMLQEDWTRDAAGALVGAVRQGSVRLEVLDPRGLAALVQL
jgi:hypothetical protein